MIRGFIKSRIGGGPVPLKLVVTGHMCRSCVEEPQQSGVGNVLASLLDRFRVERGGSGSLAAIK